MFLPCITVEVFFAYCQLEEHFINKAFQSLTKTTFKVKITITFTGLHAPSEDFKIFFDKYTK